MTFHHAHSSGSLCSCVQVLLLPPIFLAVLAISTFFMTPAGGRLGFGITVLLSSQFGKAVVMALMPVTRELLWIDLFLLFHEAFFFATLLVLIGSHFFFWYELAWNCVRRRAR